MDQPSKEEIRRKYDYFAKKYDRWEGIGEFLVIGRVRRRLLGKAKGNVLDVGIGTGKNLQHYPQGCKITGVDYSPEMLDIAKKRARNLRGKIDLREMDAQSLKFKKESFDTVVDTLGLCTYPDPVSALREMKRVCKKDGQILLLEHSLSSNTFLEALQKKVKEKQLEKLGCHVDRNMEELVKKAGLKIVSVERRFLGILYIIKARP